MKLTAQKVAWWGYVGTVAVCLKLKSYLRRLQLIFIISKWEPHFAKEADLNSTVKKQVWCIEYVHCMLRYPCIGCHVKAYPAQEKMCTYSSCGSYFSFNWSKMCNVTFQWAWLLPRLNGNCCVGGYLSQKSHYLWLVVCHRSLSPFLLRDCFG